MEVTKPTQYKENLLNIQLPSVNGNCPHSATFCQSRSRIFRSPAPVPQMQLRDTTEVGHRTQTAQRHRMGRSTVVPLPVHQYAL